MGIPFFALEILNNMQSEESLADHFEDLDDQKEVLSNDVLKLDSIIQDNEKDS